jgi:3-hydroxymyristoyl/3-hydroxydecanoyl-(acyl carrier protein) dehydratase
MPGVLLIEAMAQVGGVAMLYPPENRGKIAVFAKIDKVRFHRKVIPGDQVVTRAEVVKIHGNMGVIHCEGKVNDEPACECDCFFSLQDKAE